MTYSRLFLALLGLTLASHAGAQSLAQQGKECSGYSVPTFSCLNPVAGTQLSLSVMEFQHCENGSIHDLYTRASGQYQDGSLQIPTSTSGAGSVKVVSSGKRIHIDQWTSDSSVDLPSSATLKFEKATFEVQISDQAIADAPGVNLASMHYNGKFQQLNLQGEVVSEGTLRCTIIPH